MWTWPDTFGMTPILDELRHLPFADFFFTGFFWPGLALLLVIGVTQFTAAALIWRRHPKAPLATLFCGLVLMAWTAFQFMIWGWPPNPLSVAFFIFGLAESATALRWLRQD